MSILVLALIAALAPKTELPWIEDNFDRALAEGKAQNKPVFVDGWALWCHSCLSMRSYVLTDPSLAPLAGRFVWAAIDTEKPQNAGFVTRYPQSNWPTFFIVDPADGSVASRWVGSMSVAQLRAFLAEGERTVQLAHAGQIPPGSPLARLRAGDRAALDGKWADAARLYGEALAATKPSWPRRAEALGGRLRALHRGGDAGACVDEALRWMDSTGSSPNAADFVAEGVDCAAELPKADPRVARLRKRALARLTRLARDARAPLAADDRGDIWRMVWDLDETMGDARAAKAAARARLAVLEKAAAAAPDPQAAETFDWARAETLLYLGRGADAIQMLKASERKLPHDYNPPSRLANVYLRLGQYDLGVAAADRALARVYGPRKATILAVKASLLEKQGKLAEARKAVEEQLAIYRALPHRRPAAERAAEKRLQGLQPHAN